MKNPIYNIPNMLTMSRVIIIPIFVLIAYWPPAIGINDHAGSFIRHFTLAALFVAAAITDWFDGYLARKLNQSSPLGQFLDPVADKLMVATTLIVLVQWRPTVWMAFAAIVIISREILVSALREWMAEIGQRGQVKVSLIGKIKTTFQMVSITGFLLYVDQLLIPSYIMLYGAVVLTLWSMFIYIQAAWPYFIKQQ